MNVYYYFYYRMYRFAKKVGVVDATWTAMLLVSASIMINIMKITYLLFGKSFYIKNPIINGILSALLIGGINYYIFIRKDNCFRIIKQFENETKKQKTISIVISLIYISLTILFMK